MFPAHVAAWRQSGNVLPIASSAAVSPSQLPNAAKAAARTCVRHEQT